MRIGIEHAVVYNKLKLIIITVNKMGIQTLMQKYQYLTLLKIWVMIAQKQCFLEEYMMKCGSS
jgi:hypothetical protein